MISSPTKSARTDAAVGSLFWCLALVVRTGDSSETELIQKIFLLAVFVIVPLGLSLRTIRPEELSLKIALWMQSFAGFCVFVSFVSEQGPLAGVLAGARLSLTL